MHIKPKNKMYFLNKFLIHSSKPYIIKYVNYKLPPPPPNITAYHLLPTQTLHLGRPSARQGGRWHLSVVHSLLPGFLH